MRVLIAVHGFPPIQNNGAERVAERLAHWLLDHQHSVEVFSVGRLDASETRLDSNIENGLLVHRLSYDITEGDDPFQNTYDYPIVGKTLRTILASGQFDLVHLVSGYLFAGQVIHTAHEFHLPVVITLTEYYYMCARLNLMHSDSTLCNGPKSDELCTRCLMEEKRRFRYASAVFPRLVETYWDVATKSGMLQSQVAAMTKRRETLRDALNAADLVVCPSRFIIQKYSEFGFDTHNYLFNQHGLNKPESGITRRERSTSCLRIGYIGQIKEHKGVDLAVDAAIGLLDKNYPIELEIWGRENDDPPYYQGMIKRSLAYPGIQWRGSFEGDHVWNVLANIDVLVVPSRWFENCPSVILEAFKTGIPVIATNIGGMAELVQPGQNGLVFKLNNSADLQAQLERLFNEPALMDQIRAGIPYVKTGDEEAAIIYEAYERLLETQN